MSISANRRCRRPSRRSSIPTRARISSASERRRNIKVNGDDVSLDVELGYPAKSQIDGIRKQRHRAS